MKPADRPPGGQVGRYQLVERIAVGGMAEVHLACERGEHSLDRLVVIKRILPHLAETPEFITAFEREARLAARINHPNVVKIFELGISADLPFIVMEYVPGSTLKAVIKAANAAKQPVPLGVALHLVEQACAGAHAAHELVDAAGNSLGLVHRDLSPHNLMVDANAHVKLLDFGIAKPTAGSEQTRTGLLKGKISYMSPEQLRQESLDRRSDLFSLGIVAYELFTGHKPWTAPGDLAMMQAILLTALTPVEAHRPDVPQGIVDVILKALEPDPDTRWPTADAFRRALLQAAQDAQIAVDADAAVVTLEALLGTKHAKRRRSVEEALERTLVSFSGLDTSPPRAVDGTHSMFEGTLTGHRGAVAAGGVLISLGLMAAMAGVALVVVVAAGAALVVMSQPALEASVASVPPIVHGPPVAVLLAPTLGPDELIADHEPIREYLEATLHRPFTLEIGDSYEATARSIIDGSAHFAMLPYNTRRIAQEREPNLRTVATKQIDGSETVDGYLLVPRAFSGDDLEALRGETVCYSDRLSNTGYRLPRAYISAQGLDPDEDFEAHVSGNHPQVLRDLLDGVCMIGGTFSGNFATADQSGLSTGQLRIFAITGSTPHDALVASPSANPRLVDDIRSALEAFDPEVHAGVSRVGANEMITGFIAPDDGS